MSEKKLFLLDGNALVYRAHFAFISRPLYNSKGMNTSAITGFVRTLWDLMRNQKPTHIAIAFDPPGDTFRHKFFPEYKANRDAQPEDISRAIPYIKKIMKGFRIPNVQYQGYEADDVIGTLAKQASAEGFQVYMVTPDKDFAQLVEENIYIYKPSRQGNGVDILGVKEILEKWEIERIDQVIDVLGLQGDSVDNIPGIPGVGAKTAVKLLASYSDIEGVISHSHELKGKLKERVEEFAEQARLSRRLAVIDINAPVQFDAERYAIEEFDRPILEEVFKELEFRTLAQAILGEDNDDNKPKDLFGKTIPEKSIQATRQQTNYSLAEQNINNLSHEYLSMDTSEKREELVRKLESLSSFCFDTETTNIDPNIAELVGISFSFEKGKAYYVPVPSDRKTCTDIVNEFKGIFSNPAIEKIGQNIKYDIIVLKWYGIEVKGSLFDTMIAHYLLEPEQRHKLEHLSENFLNYKMVSIESLIGKKGRHQLSMGDIDQEKVKEYAAEDADITYQLKSIFEPKVKEKDMWDLYQNLEIPLIPVLAEIEYNGFRIDAKFLNDYSQKLSIDLIENEKAIYKQAGLPFNISSPKQVGEVLFDRLKIPYRWRRTASGQYSTNEEKLNELAFDHKIVSDIQYFRKLAKLKSTYVDALPVMINPHTGRIHSSFNQARAATGRLSSENPNLQNIPIKAEEGREVRKAFQPRDADHILLAADYSQIELRLIAEISNEEAMLEAFINNLDIHKSTAAKVYGVPIEEVTAEQRRNAKTVNFSIIYGAGSLNLSRQLDLKRTEAKELIDNYFATYTGLKKYMEDIVNFARENDYVATLMGRRRYLKDINSRNGFLRSNAERIAINTPIQGSAADMIKAAMINIHRRLKSEKFMSKMILQVHDELVFDVHRSEMDKIKPLISEEMKNAFPNLKVPIEVSMGVGENWLEAH